jgi:hypothetical protein
LSTELTGHEIGYIEVTMTARVLLAAPNTRFVLTIVNDKPGGDVWRFSLSAILQRTTRVATGRAVGDNYHMAAQQAAEQLALGYPPGSVERGLFEALAKGQITD